jgi:hypothetical protein
MTETVTVHRKVSEQALKPGRRFRPTTICTEFDREDESQNPAPQAPKHSALQKLPLFPRSDVILITHNSTIETVISCIVPVKEKSDVNENDVKPCFRRFRPQSIQTALVCEEDAPLFPNVPAAPRHSSTTLSSRSTFFPSPKSVMERQTSSGSFL